jgi:hypothetical protein
MADVSAVFGFLLALGIAFPGMLTAVWLLFPRKVEITQLRLTDTPWRCFWLGLAVAFLVGIPITIFFALPPAPAKIIGVIGLTLVLTFSTLGAAGLTSKMADRLEGDGTGKLKGASAFVGSALTLELAAFFPFIGWFIVIPFGILFSLGAATFALFQWHPKPKAETESLPEVAIEPQTVQ